MADALALLDTPSGFALFYLTDNLFEQHDAMWAWLADANQSRYVTRLIEYVRVEDKSVCKAPNGPGKELSKLLKKYCEGEELYVEDEEIRNVIYSNLKIKCSDDAYVTGEVMWGLKNVMYDLVFAERGRLDRGYFVKEPCHGLKKCIKKFELSEIAIDKEFILHAAGLYRSYKMLETTAKDLHQACYRWVPEVSHLIKGSEALIYADVMAKILTPGVRPDWDFTKHFEESIAQSLKDLDAAAEGVRGKVGYEMYHFMHATFVNLERLPGIIRKAQQFIKSLPRHSLDQNHLEKRSLVESSREVESSQGTC